VSAPPLATRPRTANWPQMRPRFVVELPCDADQVMASLRDGLADAAEDVGGQLSERHAVLHVPDAQRRFWSTQLGLTVEPGPPCPDGGPGPTRVLGIFSPHPEIWTGFVFAVGTLIGIGVFGSMYAVVQLTMGHTPWALLAPVLSTLVGALVYTSTLVGQGLAAAEMYVLRVHLDEWLEDARQRAAREPRTAMDGAQL